MEEVLKTTAPHSQRLQCAWFSGSRTFQRLAGSTGASSFPSLWAITKVTDNHTILLSDSWVTLLLTLRNHPLWVRNPELTDHTKPLKRLFHPYSTRLRVYKNYSWQF